MPRAVLTFHHQSAIIPGIRVGTRRYANMDEALEDACLIVAGEGYDRVVVWDWAKMCPPQES